MKKVLIILGLLLVGAFIAKKIKDANDERDLWHEATTAPETDLS
ncbi:DLW-39 family protein [Fodinicola acaciae]|nr:DLW-39 family protein [Fodinicola acaciae]